MCGQTSCEDQKVQEFKWSPQKGSNGKKQKLVVIRNFGEHGKTTTVWLVLLELLNRGAKLISILKVPGHSPISLPLTLPPYGKHLDFVAEVEWKGMKIFLLSHGDVATTVDAELQVILAQNPDVIICASRAQNRAGSTWSLFETKYTNLLFDRVCFWSEFAKNKADRVVVKEPTVEAVMRYIQ